MCSSTTPIESQRCKQQLMRKQHHLENPLSWSLLLHQQDLTTSPPLMLQLVTILTIFAPLLWHYPIHQAVSQHIDWFVLFTDSLVPCLNILMTGSTWWHMSECLKPDYSTSFLKLLPFQCSFYGQHQHSNPATKFDIMYRKLGKPNRDTCPHCGYAYSQVVLYVCHQHISCSNSIVSWAACLNLWRYLAAGVPSKKIMAGVCSSLPNCQLPSHPQSRSSTLWLQ